MRWPVLRPLACWLAIVLSPVAAATKGSVWLPGEDNEIWRSECGACHIAFPAQLLVASDWLKIMSQLDRHFGIDVTLEPSTSNEISDYLQRNGAGESTISTPEVLPRITSSERFAGRHRGAIRLWRRGQIKTLTDCAACHKDAGLDALKD
jgi:hypothetical protein